MTNRPKREKERKLRLVQLGALLAWAISGLMIGSAYHPLPMAAVLVALALQMRTGCLDKKQLPWTLVLAGALAAALWISPLPKDPASPPAEPEQVEYPGFTARLIQVSTTGLTAELTLANLDMELVADGTLTLKRYEKSGWFAPGKWAEAQRLYAGAAGNWKEQEVVLPADGTPVTVEYDWTYAYLELMPGWYRANIQVKEFMGETNGTKSWRVFSVPVQFEIK